MSIVAADLAVSASKQIVLAGTSTFPWDPTDQNVVPSVTALWGWRIEEAAGAPAVVALWDGDGTGTGNYELVPISLAAHAFSEIALTSPAQIHNNGIYLAVTSGEINYAIFWG